MAPWFRVHAKESRHSLTAFDIALLQNYYNITILTQLYFTHTTSLDPVHFNKLLFTLGLSRPKRLGLIWRSVMKTFCRASRLTQLMECCAPETRWPQSGGKHGFVADTWPWRRGILIHLHFPQHFLLGVAWLKPAICLKIPWFGIFPKAEHLWRLYTSHTTKTKQPHQQNTLTRNNWPLNDP